MKVTLTEPNFGDERVTNPGGKRRVGKKFGRNADLHYLYIEKET